MADRIFTLRFDVDTHRCVRDGVPRLLKLGEEVGAPFTFFINMGRAVDLRVTLAGMIGGAGGSDEATPRLSARRKLGTGGYVAAAVLNPRVGAGSPAIVRRIAAEGHELGLHGGRNHATWQAGAVSWHAERLAEEVAEGLREIERTGGPPPVGFASPGWQGPPALWPVLEEAGFRYVADLHGPGGEIGPAPGAEKLLRIPTALTGEPDGVAYLEYHRALGATTDAILMTFEEHLAGAGDYVVAYDHPYHAGMNEIDTLREMISMARGAGFTLATLAQIAASQGSAQ